MTVIPERLLLILRRTLLRTTDALRMMIVARRQVRRVIRPASTSAILFTHSSGTVRNAVHHGTMLYIGRDKRRRNSRGRVRIGVDGLPELLGKGRIVMRRPRMLVGMSEFGSFPGGGRRIRIGQIAAPRRGTGRDGPRWRSVALHWQGGVREMSGRRSGGSTVLKNGGSHGLVVVLIIGGGMGHLRLPHDGRKGGRRGRKERNERSRWINQGRRVNVAPLSSAPGGRHRHNTQRLQVVQRRTLNDQGTITAWLGAQGAWNTSQPSDRGSKESREMF